MTMERKAIKERAGTALDHRFTVPIYSSSTGTRKQHGTVDNSQHLYQCGGELGNFVFWKKRAVTLAADVWRQIEPAVNRLEFIDHDKNVCYWIDADIARAEGYLYNAGIGDRWGIPLELFNKETP